MSFIHVVGGLPLSLGDGVSASSKAILDGVPYSSLVKCPSQDILVVVIIFPHRLVLVS